MSDDPLNAMESMTDMMRLWFDMASRTTEACQAMAGSAISPDAMRSSRSHLFKTWSDNWEQFLRSSQFLEAQKQAMSGGAESQKRMREYLGWLHHEMQLATSEDIDQLMKSFRRLSEDFAEQFEQMDRRLKTLSTKLDDLSDHLKSVDRPSTHERSPVANHRNQSTKQNRAGKTR